MGLTTVKLVNPTTNFNKILPCKLRTSKCYSNVSMKISCDGFPALSRRNMVNYLSYSLLASTFLESPALGSVSSESTQVRLKDVSNKALQLALEYATNGDFVTAEKLFDDLISDNPESASLWSNRGNVRMSLGRYADAIPDFSKAIELAPYAPVPFLNRGIAHEVEVQYKIK